MVVGANKANAAESVAAAKCISAPSSRRRRGHRKKSTSLRRGKTKVAKLAEGEIAALHASAGDREKTELRPKAAADIRALMLHKQKKSDSDSSDDDWEGDSHTVYCPVSGFL